MLLFFTKGRYLIYSVKYCTHLFLIHHWTHNKVFDITKQWLSQNFLLIEIPISEKNYLLEDFEEGEYPIYFPFKNFSRQSFIEDWEYEKLPPGKSFF